MCISLICILVRPALIVVAGGYKQAAEICFCTRGTNRDQFGQVSDALYGQADDQLDWKINSTLTSYIHMVPNHILSPTFKLPPPHQYQLLSTTCTPNYVPSSGTFPASIASHPYDPIQQDNSAWDATCMQCLAQMVNRLSQMFAQGMDIDVVALHPRMVASIYVSSISWGWGPAIPSPPWNWLELGIHHLV